VPLRGREIKLQRAMRLRTITLGFSLVLNLALAVRPASGQAQAPKDSLPAAAADPSVITLPVTVRDKKGQIVRDLTKDDLVLQADGKPQTIKYFAQVANLPVSLGLLIDTSWSQRDFLDQERNASRTFLDQMLVQEKDKAFLLHFDREVELLQDLTHKREKLQSALELLKTSDRERANDDSDSRSGSGHGHEGTQLYDAVYLASNELLQKQPGRKTVIILSDGVDRGSKTTLQSAIESAQRSDTVVYSILLAGHQERSERRRDEGSGSGRPGGGWPGGGGGYPGGGGGWPGGGGPGSGPGGNRRPGGGQRPQEEPRVDGKKILEQLSKETGGRSFEVSKKQSVGEIYTAIAEELRTQYSLGFTPEKSDSGGYHHLQLQAKRKDLVVQTREGYYGGGD
jgi:VWFA-related protein